MLRYLRLDNNQIKAISFGSFDNLLYLKSLNISNNPLVNIPRGMLRYALQFELLYVLNVNPNDFNVNALQYSNMRVVVSSDYHLCCIVPRKSICLPSKPLYFSCTDLLPDVKQSILFITVAIIVILLNTLSTVSCIIISKIGRKSQTSFTRIVITRNLTDTLCGIALGIIWIADKMFKGVFVVKDEFWRSSLFCFVIFGTVIWFILLSQLNLILLSSSRLYIVLYPITSKFKDTQFVSEIMSLIFISSFVTSLVVTLLTKFIQKTLPLGWCLPFLDPTGSFLTIKVLTWCTVFTHSFTSVVILIMHSLLIIKVNESDKNIQSTRSSQHSNISLLIQMAIIALSHIICWFPANVIFVSAMVLPKYPTELVLWTIVIIIPISSVINPLVFLITSLKNYFKGGHTSKTVESVSILTIVSQMKKSERTNV